MILLFKKAPKHHFVVLYMQIIITIIITTTTKNCDVLCGENMWIGSALFWCVSLSHFSGNAKTQYLTPKVKEGKVYLAQFVEISA